MPRDREALIEVDLDEVWTVINENLPQLLAYIEPLTLPES
jgi:uncharacterized protein with HEPN domain